MPSASYTKIASPIPSVPPSNYQYIAISQTIEEYPDLFKIITPIHVDHLEMKLSNHPNCALVDSICKGLCYGFWPFADTGDPACQPTGVVLHQDSALNLDDESIDFLKQQRDK